ncbi:MAG: WYL domain-containing protein [Clostridia bacterium]|nr:WYL domain-containing protein [Clostridia bacterium]
MPRKENQRKKLLILRDILLRNTDERHGLTRKEIEVELSRYDIEVSRQTFAEDLELLREFGVDIMTDRVGSKTIYYVGEREFALPELKLLIDSIQASRFITEKKAMELIRKMEKLCSKHEAAELQRGAVIVDRIKNMNESIFYNVDAVHQAINQNSKIRFQYFNYNIQAEREYKHGGKIYEESPYAMVCTDDNYYLLAYNSERNIIKNYRVDKLAAVQVTGEPREGREVFEQYDLKRFTRNSFGMFSGKEAKVTMRFSHRFANAVVDRFGKDVFMRRVDDNWVEVVAPVVVSPMFFRWLYGLGAEAYIVGPQDVKEAMKNHLLEVSKLYE